MSGCELLRAGRGWSTVLGSAEAVAASARTFGGKDVGEVVLADDDFDVDAEVVGVAEDFEDAAAGGAAGGGEVGDLDVDGEAFEGAADARSSRCCRARASSPRTRWGLACGGGGDARRLRG